MEALVTLSKAGWPFEYEDWHNRGRL